MAAEWCKRCFPVTWPKNKKKSKTLSSVREEDKIIWPPSKPLPYLGLTQVCTVIRTEFRPLWLSTHLFPLFVLDGYLGAFFPAPLPKSANEDLRKRVEKYHDPAGTLRLWVTAETMKNADILKLLKFKLRFPAYTITPTSYNSQVSADHASLTTILTNTKPTWIKWIRTNAIKQVRVRINGTDRYHIVVKEKYAPPWMRIAPNNRPYRYGLLESLGLNPANLGMDVSFGVDYS
jgi:hypothetical protein